MKFSIPRILLVLAVLTAFLAMPLGTRAQTTATHLSTLQIELWPEFDRPDMLVILKMALPAASSLPAAVELRLPTGATVNAVAEFQVSNLINVVYQTRTEANWKVISFTATVPEIQVEYYDPGLIKNENARHYEMIWPNPFTVDSFTLKVQQPLDATDMVITPTLGSNLTGSDGLTYFQDTLGPMGSEETFQITIDYNKANDRLTAENMQVEPADPLNGTGTTTTTSTALSPVTIGLIGAGVLGLALIIGGALWYYFSTIREPAPAPRKRHAPASKTKAAIDIEDDAVYCQQCGRRASAGDRFCRQCGARLRID
jgi:hypothetical protein